MTPDHPESSGSGRLTICGRAPIPGADVGTPAARSVLGAVQAGRQSMDVAS